MCEITEWILLVVLIAMAVWDWKYKKIPVCLFLFMSILVLMNLEEGIRSMLGGALLGGIFWGVSVFTKESIGYGDSWLVTLLGISVGGKNLLGILMTSFLLSGLYALYVLRKSHWKRNVTIPFIPFLTLSYMGVLFF